METNKQNEIRNAYEHSAQVQCIPASIKKTTEHSEEDPLVVAPYCRVSTDNKDQLASYELQCQYYKEYVSKHPGWRLYDIYADEGISGTSVKKRTDFLRMIDDCKAGKIDMIIVKNIARFARNVVDCVATVRMLKALDKPVAVYFEDIAINTLTQTGELLMVVMAAIAQGESEAKSESARVVHHAEQLRRFCRDAVQNFIKAERPGLTKHLQQIEKLRLVAARGERLAHRSGAVVVPLAGGAAEQ